MRRLGPAGGIALAALAGALLLSSPSRQGFPHEQHEGLFPSCVGCHVGAETGDGPLVAVEPAACAGCHDGVEREVVEWTALTPKASNLAFNHVEHAEKIREEGRPLDCAACHRPEGVDVRMAVDRAVESKCLDCHAPEAESHFALAVDCAECHVSLAEARGLPRETIATFPEPPGHAAADFILAHGPAALERGETCAVCHTRDSCARCHLNADAVPAIASLQPDARVAALVLGRPGEWPEPESHDRSGWATRLHAAAAEADPATCASCHARPSCEACHRADPPAVLARLPMPRADGPRGVSVAQVEPVGHTADFTFNHAAAAATGAPNCAACHSEGMCVDCHDGSSKPDFHPVGFAVRHGAEAFANDTECAACHSREAFCRDCHMGVGLAAGSRTTGGAFHDAQPDWLLAHGLPARQDLEACTTCHEQRSCLRCHSARQGFRVSPHGPDFDPQAVAGKSTMSCGICHFDLPEGISP
ncbi:MAG TPA: cytochrome c3 family protein [Gemmatimonadota bacterium]|nr:cytochrome c3 family protein [Gemmatimonadota bacterium]